MRIRIMEDVATVGLLLTAGEICDVDEPLAKALIDRDQAEDACGSCVAIPVVEVEIEPEVAEEEPEVAEEEPKPPKKPPKKAKK